MKLKEKKPTPNSTTRGTRETGESQDGTTQNSERQTNTPTHTHTHTHTHNTTRASGSSYDDIYKGGGLYLRSPVLVSGPVGVGP